ncbi:hypothetical protein [Methanoregula sp.]|uniref:hypothetical protein n=1 Tax=Methanoregula sp. TaxID=2052170 RepID=UPI002624BF5E|nr:hypothetical protein [Methanoregula sp.]MDD5144238.1 hypothetical protein [Methanoregula sp.]
MTEVPEVPDVAGVNGTAVVCVATGDTGGWEVSVHAVTRTNAKSNPATMTAGILFFMIDDILVEIIMRDTYLF